MKQNLTIFVVLLLFVLVICIYLNAPGKYQVVSVIHPYNYVAESCLLDTRTGKIRRLGTAGSNQCRYIWGNPEFLNTEEFDQWYKTKK
jgi:hypothetical protein